MYEQDCSDLIGRINQAYALNPLEIDNDSNELFRHLDFLQQNKEAKIQQEVKDETTVFLSNKFLVAFDQTVFVIGAIEVPDLPYKGKLGKGYSNFFVKEDQSINFGYIK